jgi:glycosyltransferase involved in cell wall biosynthesis
MDAAIVIPTYNRAPKLANLLRCLERQDGAASFEVMVCDDGSSDDTRAVAEAAAAALDLHYFHQPDLGFRAGQARNMGIAAARGEIVIFLDDDTLPAPDFVASHVRAHREAGVPAVAIGMRHRADRLDALPANVADISRHEPDGRVKQIGPRGETLDRVHPAWRLLYSCNFSAPRTSPELRFSETFEGWGMEDHEIGYRLLRAGLRLVMVPGAPVLHIDDPVPRDPFLAESRNVTGHFDSYVHNLLRLQAMHGADAEIDTFVREQLRWLWFDQAKGHWFHGGRPRVLWQFVATAVELERVAVSAGVTAKGLKFGVFFSNLINLGRKSANVRPPARSRNA